MIDLVDEPSSLDPRAVEPGQLLRLPQHLRQPADPRRPEARSRRSSRLPGAISDTELEFDIRQGVKFHDGTPLTVDDVVFSIRRIINPEFRSPQLSRVQPHRRGRGRIGFDKVRIRTSGPYPVLLAQLSSLSVVPRA